LKRFNPIRFFPVVKKGNENDDDDDDVEHPNELLALIIIASRGEKEQLLRSLFRAKTKTKRKKKEIQHTNVYPCEVYNKMTNFSSFCKKVFAFLAGVFGGSKMLHSL
jgi:hypothetical protein|tara:strand:+ start:1904 stop:2224 length:321 start_codon:yes stop_codon:yes gene_type:complete